MTSRALAAAILAMTLFSILISSESDNADVGWDNDGWVVAMLGMVTELVTGESVLLLTITELLLTTHATEVVTTTAAVTADTAGAGESKLTLLRPNVEKSKSSGLRAVSPFFSKKLLSSFLDLNLLPVGPMIKTSYRPAEAPLFLCDTFLFQPTGKVYK